MLQPTVSSGSTHSILLDYLEIRLRGCVILHVERERVGGAKPVLIWNISRGVGESEQDRCLPACLGKSVIQSWETNDEERAHFALWLFAHYAQTLQNAPPRRDSSQ